MQAPALLASVSHRVGRCLAPDANPSGIVYGVLTVGTLIAAEGARRETYFDLVGSSVLAVILYWLAHGYSRSFGVRVDPAATSPGPSAVAEALVTELSILQGALLPVAAVLVSWACGSRLASGVTAGLWTAGVELVLLEVGGAIVRRDSARRVALDASIGVVLGLGILGVRILVH